MSRPTLAWLERELERQLEQTRGIPEADQLLAALRDAIAAYAALVDVPLWRPLLAWRRARELAAATLVVEDERHRFGERVGL